MGKGNKKRPIDISELDRDLNQPFYSILLFLHAFIGYDSTNIFKGKDKEKSVKVLQQKPAFKPVLAQRGDSWEVQEQVMND